MRTFANIYPDKPFVQQVAAQIPWFHNCVLMDKVKDQTERTWYIQKTIENGWSRNVLVLQIESSLYARQGGAITNFERTLPKPQSDLAQQLIKDPYNFDFLTIGDNAQERELENALVRHMRDFLLELGLGFSFMGSQYPIEVDSKEYRIDLLFYHVQLHCYVVIDLKMGDFEPQHSGQMSFYVAAVDNLLRSDRDDPTIGIILCKNKSKTTVEYALQGNIQPIGVSTFQTATQLPQALRERLPTPEQLEMEFESALQEIESQTEN